MKFIFILIVLFFSLSSFRNAISQDSLLKDIKVGFGATIEKDYSRKLDRFSNPSIGITKILLPIYIKSMIKIQPELSYWDYTFSQGTDRYSYKVFHYGIGAFYAFNFGSTFIYLGPRYAIDDLSSPILQLNEDDGDTVTDKSIGITLGGEYFISNHFSIGLEVQYNSYSIGAWDEWDKGNKIHATEALIFISLYIL